MRQENNIAEGSYRKPNKDFTRFLNQFLASLYKLLASLDLLLDSGYINKKECDEFSKKKINSY